MDNEERTKTDNEERVKKLKKQWPKDTFVVDDGTIYVRGQTGSRGNAGFTGSP